MSGERPGAADDGTPVRDRRRRWVAPEQPTSPEDRAGERQSGEPEPGRPTKQPSDSTPARSSTLRPGQTTTPPHREHAAAEAQSREPEPRQGASSRPTDHFPEDPASPAPHPGHRHPRFRRPQPQARHPSVTAIWERSEQEHQRFATRFAGQLLLVGAGLGSFLTLFLGVPQGVFSASWYEFLGANALAAVWGLVYVLLPSPAPDLVLRATPALSALLITLTLSLNHSNAADGMLLLNWPLLFAAYLLPRRTAYWTLAIVAVCLTVILLAGSGPDRFATWVEITTSMALTLIVIRRVRDQAERLKQALAEQASTDPLTGLSNRRAFDEALEREVTRQRRTRAPLSLLAVDVDHFKQINDTWGHAAGDDTLAALGDLLPRLVRSSDTVSRVGGEEFGVLLPDCPAPQARARADALRAEIWAASRDWKHPVTVSVGVATLPDSADALNDLLVAADMALYAAKESGRDRVRVAPNRARDDVP
ncbi:sensor domain-containing diguanylate cyclase [Catenulispora rubra]|uniref:sensor domain-containing diguanylate cyclase n=1 Tax=Catenulispora rubra TaxID=280293 RepID=UPI0018921506|nr:sensor domain-containing diguanylate cyclase [Catenulispora rubra]